MNESHTTALLRLTRAFIENADRLKEMDEQPQDDSEDTRKESWDLQRDARRIREALDRCLRQQGHQRLA